MHDRNQTNYFYMFPAVRGMQAGREFYIATCPLLTIPKIFSFEHAASNIIPAATQTPGNCLRIAHPLHAFRQHFSVGVDRHNNPEPGHQHYQCGASVTDQREWNPYNGQNTAHHTNIYEDINE